MTDVSAMTVAVLGGTGDQGQGLAYRFALPLGRVGPQ